MKVLLWIVWLKSSIDAFLVVGGKSWSPMVCEHGANKNIDLSILQTRLQAQAVGVNYQRQVASAMELPTFSKVMLN
jgi:hypothetical protein